MLILTVRTDKPEAEIGLLEGEKKLAYHTWLAHRQLAETIHLELKKILKSQTLQLKDLEGVAVFKGPGSFTGLRIGISVANALADSLQIPIVAEADENWISQSIKRLEEGENEQIVLPEYGSPPHVTTPKH